MEENEVYSISPDVVYFPYSVPEIGEDYVYDEEYGIQVMALGPITSSTGLKGILFDLLGPYDGIVVQYRYMQNSSTNYTYVNDVQLDYPWIFSAVLFIVLLYSLFRTGAKALWQR